MNRYIGSRVLGGKGRSTFNVSTPLAGSRPKAGQRSTFDASVIVLLMALVISAQALATPRPKVVMIVVPTMSLREMASGDLPGFSSLLDKGCVGLMNSRTAGRIATGVQDFEDGKYAPEAGYMTIGAGARTQAGGDASKAYNADETVQGAPARDVFERITLISAGKSEVVQPCVPRLVRENSTLSYKVTIGALGTALHKAGLKTAVIGNSDDALPHREAVTIDMDKNGLVDFGNVGPEMVMRDPTAPSGYRTNEKKLLSEFDRCMNQADFIVVELGDSARLDRARFDMMDAVYNAQRTLMVKRTERVLSNIMRATTKYKAKIVVLSPYPSSYELEKNDNSLCPVMFFEGVSLQDRGGLLTSGSTRAAGVITNTDVAPSVVNWLNVPPVRGLVGRTIYTKPGSNPGGYLAALTRHTAQQTATAPVLRQAMVVVIILVAIATLLWFTIPTGSALRRKVLAPIALVPPALAPAMMLLALCPTGSQFVTWLGLIAVTAVIVGLCALIGRKAINALMLISLGATAVFLADIALGDPMTRFSIMGYSIVEGARYYGIGNEFMGALIGACLAGLGLWMGMRGVGKKAMQWILSAGLVVGTVAIGAPMLGANMGGAISVVIGFGCALMATSKKALDFKKAFGVIFGVVLFIAIFAYMDSLRGAQHASHLGRALQGIKEGGIGEAGKIITRKLAMNWMLIRLSVWSRLLGAYIVSLGAVLIPRKAYTRLAPLPLHLRVAIAGVTAGTIAALVFNDSGIVAAATCFVYAWSLIFVAALDSQSQAITE